MTASADKNQAAGLSREQLQALLQPRSFPHAVDELQIRETHVSLVILTGPYAYKIKKAVKFPFIDASTLEHRRRYCEEELRLNRRLAPELYLDVVPIVRKSDHLLVDAPGPPIEYAVRMRQFDANEELTALLRDRRVSTHDVTALGELLADFHERAAMACGADSIGRTEQMRAAVFDNLSELLEQAAGLSAELQVRVRRLAEWTREQAHVLDASLRLRERSGKIREGHGDLHAANIVRSEGRLVPFDCLEFSPELRWIDVISDVAFLVMDLTSHDRDDLAHALLSRYLECTGDYEGMPLLPFYAVYRALVRAKVEALGASRSGPAVQRKRMHRRIRDAMQWTRRPSPVLLLMHGPSGSGKSWLSERLVPALPALRVRSDLERKRLAGMEAREPGAAGIDQGIYSSAFSDRTYERLAQCARLCLQAGFHTIVDAAFLDPARRAAFAALAKEMSARYRIVSCRAPRDRLAARVQRRLSERHDPSDADLQVLEAQLQTLQPFSTPEQARLMSVDTAEAEVVERVVAWLR